MVLRKQPQIRAMSLLTKLTIFTIAIMISQCTCKLPGMLYPRDSESRTLRYLDGMWNFRVDKSPSRNESFEQKWYSRSLTETGPVIPMSVPSSYNDITNDKSIRDFVGWAWYDRTFYVDNTWGNRRNVLRIDSAHYNTIVWVNGMEAMRHSGGHLPFEADVKSLLNFHGENRITVAINNTLTPITLPPGSIEYKTDTTRYPAGYFVQNLQMDFFNYAGIHRHVTLYTTPLIFTEDIDITTNIDGENGVVTYSIYEGGQFGFIKVNVEILDKQGNIVGQSTKQTDTIVVQNAKLWWPYTMNEGKDTAYIYTLKVMLSSENSTDVYRQPFGIRTVDVTNTQLLINGKPFYCHGAAKHEDADIRGKGLDYALIARDFNMLKWLGVNCFRTSHYPYAEEIMDQADRQGIVVIDESPGVGIGKTKRSKRRRYKFEKIETPRQRKKKNRKKERNKRLEEKVKVENERRRRRQISRHSDMIKRLSVDPGSNFGPESLAHHIEVMSEMYQRDKNRPSVIMWSVANEPATNLGESQNYFKSVIAHVRSLDKTRPVSFVCNQDYNTDKAVQYTDIILLNRYYGWYSNIGHTEVIQLQLERDLRNWHSKYNIPVIITEYGADTIAGLHQEPSFVFTEEYQVDFLREYHKTFDKLMNEFLVGEMVWNFADFMTTQGVTRVVGNRKGLLTRQRQPKMSAHLVRDRYMSLITGNRNLCRF